MTRDRRSRVVPDGGPDTALFESFPDPLLAYERAGRAGENEGADASEDDRGTDASGDDGRADASEAPAVVGRVNAAFEAVFGLAAEEVVGTPLDEVELTGTVVPEDDGDGDGAGAGTGGATGGSDAPAPNVDDGGAPGDEATDPRTATTAGSILDRLRGDAGNAVRFRRGADDDGARDFRVRDTVDGVTDGGGYLLFTEVTELERQRRDLAATVTRLERLVSVARHDLRNPLEVAEIRLEAARDTGEDVHFEKVAGALDRIERIVRDVLAVGGSIEPTDAVVLEEVARDAWGTVDTADARLVVSAGLPTVRGDADRLRGLFENLFRNSVEHGSAESRDVTVTVEPLPDGFVVVDDGPGIPEKARERVFEVGYSTRDDGSGLGLSIVRQVAREHGWYVSLAPGRSSSTATGGGARFEFTGVEPVGSETDSSGPDGSSEPE